MATPRRRGTTGRLWARPSRGGRGSARGSAPRPPARSRGAHQDRRPTLPRRPPGEAPRSGRRSRSRPDCCGSESLVLVFPVVGVVLAADDVEVTVELHVLLARVGRYLDLVVALLVADLGLGDFAATRVLERAPGDRLLSGVVVAELVGPDGDGSTAPAEHGHDAGRDQPFLRPRIHRVSFQLQR